MDGTLWAVRSSVYEAAGGGEAFVALARAHHDRCLADPVLEHPFSHPGDPHHVERLAAYWAEVTGGPPGPVRQTPLQRMHAGNGGGMSDLGRRFVRCFTQAMDDAALPDTPQLREVLRASMEWAVADVLAFAPRGSTVPADLPTPRWTWDSPRSVAVDNNIDRCDAVARAAGIETHRDDDRWWATRRTPPFQPDAITRRPGLSAAAVLAGVDTAPGCSVKDSYADLDLAPHGFGVLIEGRWVWRGPRDPEQDASARPSGVVTRSGPVVGVSDTDDWAGALAAAAAVAPDAPVVAWGALAELDAATAAGWRVTGPLRVSLREA